MLFDAASTFRSAAVLAASAEEAGAAWALTTEAIAAIVKIFVKECMLSLGS